jgi:hypothetical protein
VAKRKRAKTKSKRISFRPGSSKKKKKRRIAYGPSLRGILKVSAVVCVLAAVGIGFIFLHKYVKKAVPVSQKSGFLQLVNPPAWVSEQLEEKIYAAARADGEDLKLDEDAARSVRNNLIREVAWLDEIRVRVTNDRLLIEARWRKPIAMVKRGLHKFYVDADMVVLDYLPMPGLPIAEVIGLSLIRKVPPTGTVWQRDELAAAVDVLKLLRRMDEEVTPDKPLLREIEAIDMSNFAGRENSRAAHIVLYAKDRTQIIWGAEVGMWQRYLEATDEDKLAKLYGYYKEHGSLLNGVKYINLRDPQDKIPLPIDKY